MAVRPTRDYVVAGQAAGAAGASVRFAGGSGTAVSRAAADAFNQALKDLEPQASAATLAIGAMGKAASGLQQLGLLASFSLHRLHTALEGFARHIGRFVELANPALVQRFNIVFQDFMGVMGRILVPLLQNVTLLFQKLADNIFALGAPAKSLIGLLFGMAVGMAITAASIIAVNLAVQALNIAIAASTGGLAAIFQVIGAAAGLLVGTGTGLLFAVGTLEDFRKILDDVLPAIRELANALAGALMPVMQQMVPVIVQLANSFASIVQSLTPLIKLLGQDLAIALKTLLFTAQTIAAILALFFGGASGKAADKAPPAVRQVQSGDIQSFLNRQFVAALQGVPAGKSEIAGIADDVKAIRTEIENRKNQANAGKGAVAGLYDAKVLFDPIGIWGTIRDRLGIMGDK